MAIRIEPYTNPKLLSGIQLFGLYAKPSTSLRAPVAGRVTIKTDTDPSFPSGKVYGYLLITSADKTQVAFFLGAVGIDVEVLVKDQENVGAGAPVLKVIGSGPSDLYYIVKGVTPYQVMGYWRDPGGHYVDIRGKETLFGAPAT